HGLVGLRARMRLHVGVVRAEQLLQPVDRQPLGHVHELAAAVVALAGVTLGVLVGQLGALRLHHPRAGVVLRGDQLDMVLLSAPLVGDGGGQFRVVTFDAGVFWKHPEYSWQLRGTGRNCSFFVPFPAPRSPPRRRSGTGAGNPAGPPPAIMSRFPSPPRPAFAGPAFACGAPMSQYIYTMNRVSKVVPPKRQIIKDISLSFFPGAKIGLLGLNGAGKSTVLRIMAGVDTDFEGEARPQPGIKVGYLAQEPQLNPEHTVREAVEEGVGEVLQAQAELEKVYAAYAEEDADFDALAKEQERLEAILASGDANTLEQQLEVAADALRLPP